jgi:hypothetical protein
MQAFFLIAALCPLVASLGKSIHGLFAIYMTIGRVQHLHQSFGLQLLVEVQVAHALLKYWLKILILNA